MQTHSSGSVFKVFCWFDLKRHKDPAAGLWGLSAEERDLQVKRLMKRGNRLQAREVNATGKAVNTVPLFVSPTLCSWLCLLHIDSAFLFPLCVHDFHSRDKRLSMKEGSSRHRDVSCGSKS